MNLSEQQIREKLLLVLDRLMKLDDTPEEISPEKREQKAGFVRRDFGIREWDWPQGVGLYGIRKLCRREENEEYREFLEEWYRTNIREGLPSRNINTTAPLLTLADMLDELPEPEYEALCLDWAGWLADGLPRTDEGGFQHVTTAIGDRQGVILNENQMWVDTLFMAVLFLARMGRRCGRRDWFDESVYQVLIHIKYLYDRKTGLFCHGWTFREHSNFGGILWCRGNSWFTLGIMEYLEIAGDGLDPAAGRLIRQTYLAQAEALRALQGENGLWHTILDDPDSYEEASGSAAIAAGILKGVRLGILDESFAPCAEKAVGGLLGCIDENGIVRKVSAGTGMGMDADHYRNILIAPMAYGQSLTMIALIEALQYLDSKGKEE